MYLSPLIFGDYFCILVIILNSIFIRRRCACTVYAVTLYLSVRLSVVSGYCTKIDKRRITQTMMHNSRQTLVFLCRRFWWYSVGVTWARVPNTGGV